LKKIYSISDIEYEIIEPYINIQDPSKSASRKVVDEKTINKKIAYKNIEINSADSSELIESLGLAPWLARRTILYRNILGGYVNKNQLKEVYGFNNNIFNSIENYIEIDTSSIRKIDINNVDFKELLKHPYFDYSITKNIFDVRNKIGSFSSVDQIKLIDGINDSTFIKVRYYLYIRPSKK
jgi:DNA uptake protein ComE-like DNA-binding protein